MIHRGKTKKGWRDKVIVVVVVAQGPHKVVEGGQNAVRLLPAGGATQLSSAAGRGGHGAVAGRRKPRLVSGCRLLLVGGRGDRCWLFVEVQNSEE